MLILRFEKSRRFEKISVGFLSFLVQKCPIGIYRKTAPTKSTVLGPGPPPWRKVKIYRFLSIFNDFGAFNRAGKTVSKIGIYALPPSKREIYGIFNNSLPNFVPYTILLKFKYIYTQWFNNLLPNLVLSFSLFLLRREWTFVLYSFSVEDSSF
jgi:hypothetical protein